MREPCSIIFWLLRIRMMECVLTIRLWFLVVRKVICLLFNHFAVAADPVWKITWSMVTLFILKAVIPAFGWICSSLRNWIGRTGRWLLPRIRISLLLIKLCWQLKQKNHSLLYSVYVIRNGRSPCVSKWMEVLFHLRLLIIAMFLLSGNGKIMIK